MMEELGGDEEGRAFLLNNIGSARVRAGDVGGLDDLEESVAISEGINSADIARGYGNLASLVTDLGQLGRRAELLQKGAAAAKRFGLADDRLWLGSELLWELTWRPAGTRLHAAWTSRSTISKQRASGWKRRAGGSAPASGSVAETGGAPSPISSARSSAPGSGRTPS